MNITGNARIFKNVYDGKNVYKTSITNKDKDGKTEYYNISVQLPKDSDIENNTVINITQGFLGWYKSKDGIAKPKAVVMSYEVIGEENKTEGVEQNENIELPF